MNITKIVITGGPCAGKSTAMSWVQNAFTQMGYMVLFVPETATELITGGVAPWTCGSNAEYQKCQLKLQRHKEKIFEDAAWSMDTDNVLIVCDRGALDNKAYMVHWGFNTDRCRIKYRCPLACGKIDKCPHKSKCSPSKYGRTVYVKPDWDLRLFTRIPRGSDAWKAKYKKRTCAERVNNRILNNYGVEKNCKTKKRISFFSMIAGFNIHLDTQLKYLASKGLFDFEKLFMV